MSSYDEAREAARRAFYGGQGRLGVDPVATVIDTFLAKLSETHDITENILSGRFISMMLQAEEDAKRFREKYAVVLREPTEAMLDAAVRALEFSTSETEYSTPRAVWAAMLAQEVKP